MEMHVRNASYLFVGLLQRLAFWTVLGLALLLTAATLAAAFGWQPWLQFSVDFGGVTYDNAGQIFQLAITALMIGLTVYLPANRRIMALETSHRNFHIRMEDVARAYAVSHASDRTGIFRTASEFDAVRERLAFLRDHPDLAELEPSVLEVAAQMSQISHELAEVYSDEKVARARDFLIQRQQEIQTFNTRLDRAKQAATEIRHWSGQVELDETVARSQLTRLREELSQLLPELDRSVAERPRGPVAIGKSHLAAAE